MKALVLGAGSIGARRGRLLASLGHEVWFLDPDVHASVVAARQLPEGMGHVAEPSVLPEVDVALICTPPGSGRAEQARIWGQHVRGLYVEKPLGLGADEVEEVAAIAESYRIGRGLVTMGACNLRFCGGVRHFAKIPKPWRVLDLVMRQHKKHWNPNHEPVSLVLDSIHELDLATYLQGDIESIRGNSDLDFADLSVHHEGGGLTHIHMDRVTEPPQRMMTVWRDRKKQDALMLRVDDKVYRRELEYFMDCVESGYETGNSLRQMARTTLWALEVVQ